MLVNKCGKFYHIEKTTSETIKQSIERSWFVVNHLHLEDSLVKTKEEFEESEKISRIHFNIKVLDCSYSEELNKKIEDLENKVFV